MPNDINWLVVGDFNLIKKLEDRNRPRGNVGEMLMFNNAISSLGVVEIPLHGRKENIHGLISSSLHSLRDLIGSFLLMLGPSGTPLPLGHSLVMETFDHLPYVVEVEQFQRGKFLDLKIIGCHMQISYLWLPTLGMPPFPNKMQQSS